MKDDLTAVRLFFAATMVISLVGCQQRYRQDLDYSYPVEQTWRLDDHSFGDITQFAGVFFRPSRTESLRSMVIDDRIAANRKVLEIGTGTGLISVTCLLHDADVVVATDRSPTAVSNAHYNTAELAPDFKLDARLRPESQQDAFSAVEATEKFDLIIADLDYQVGNPKQNHDEFMQTLLRGLNQHLAAGGRCLLISSNRTVIESLQIKASGFGCACKTDDVRDLTALEPDFAPTMIWELRATSQ